MHNIGSKKGEKEQLEKLPWDLNNMFVVLVLIHDANVQIYMLSRLQSDDNQVLLENISMIFIIPCSPPLLCNYLAIIVTIFLKLIDTFIQIQSNYHL